MTTGSKVRTRRPSAMRAWRRRIPKESALLATLNPGAYTAIVDGVSGATGVGLVEVYDTSPGP